MKIKNQIQSRNDNVIMLPLKLGGPNAPRVDVSVLRMIGSTFHTEETPVDLSENIFAS